MQRIEHRPLDRVGGVLTIRWVNESSASLANVPKRGFSRRASTATERGIESADAAVEVFEDLALGDAEHPARARVGPPRMDAAIDELGQILTRGANRPDIVVRRMTGARAPSACGEGRVHRSLSAFPSRKDERCLEPCFFDQSSPVLRSHVV